jgi:hypothetical protein
LAVETAGCGGGGGAAGGAPPPAVASATRSSADASPAGGVPANGLATATITVVVRDGTGTPVAGAVVAFASSGSGNTISEPAQPTGADGVATGTIASTVAERKTITVTVDAGSPGAVTLATTPVVEFSAEARLAFVGAPGAAAAGSAIPGVSVAIVDASGAPLPAATNAVTITLGNARGATLSGTSTQGAIGGVAIFPDLDVDRAAAGYTLVAAASGFADVTSAPFDVSGGTAATLVFRTQPSSAADVTFIAPPVEVLALDRFGNVATGFGAEVQVALGAGAGSASLFGTLTKPAAAGLTTFSNLDVDTPGSYTLVASAGGLTGATSAAFAIHVGPPVALAAAFLAPLPGYPGIAAGTPLPPLEVHVVDAGGFDAIGSAGPVSVTIVSNPVGGTLLGATTLTPGPSNVVTFTAVAIDREAPGNNSAPYVLGVTASGLPLLQVGSLNVVAAPLTHVTFTAQPPARVLAEFRPPGTVAIQATDDFGNADIGGWQNGTVTLALGANPGGATLLGSTSAFQTSGQASFPGEPRVSAAGQGYTLVATLADGAAGTSVPFDVVAPVRVTSFASDRERAQVKDQATLSWTIAGGPPDAVTLDPGGKSEASAASGSDQATPFSATPVMSADPRATFRLSASLDPLMQTDTETLAAASRSANNGSGYSQPQAIAALPDGSALFAGVFYGTVIFGPDGPAPVALTSGGNGNDEDLFVARYNPDLTLAWVKTTGTNGAFISGPSLAAFPDGGALVTGYFLAFQSLQVVFGPGEAGQVTLTAEAPSTADRFIARYAPDGSIVWAKRAQGNGSFSGVAAASDGSAIVFGTVSQPSLTLGPDDPSPVTLQPTSAYTNTFVARYFPDGTVAWAGGQAFSPSGSITADLVAASPDGGAVVAGRYSPDLTVGPVAFAPGSSSNFYLARYGPDGTLAWAKRIVGAAGDDPYSAGFSGLTALPDGSVMFGGMHSSSFQLTFGPDDPAPVVLPPEASFFLARFAADGTVAWARRGASGGGFGQFSTPPAMAALPDGSAIFMGTFSGTIEFDPDGAAPLSLAVSPSDFGEVFVVGFGPDGAVSWADQTNNGELFPATAIGASDGSTAIFAGNYGPGSPPTFGANGPAPVVLPAGSGSNDAFVAAYAPFNFALTTVRPEGLAFAGAAGGAGADAGNAVAAEADGGALVAGSFESTLTFGAAGASLAALGTDDAFLARFGPDGSVAWAKQAGGAGASTIARGLAGTLDGGAVAVGSYSGAVATFGPNETNATTLAVLGGQDIFVARYAADGSLLWAKRAGGGDDDEALAVATLPPRVNNGIAVVTGYFNGTAVFGPDDTMIALSALGAADAAFVAQFDLDGTLHWAVRAGGTGATRGHGAAGFPDGTSAVTGFFNGTATFGPDGPAPVTLTSAGGADIFVARYDASGTLLWVRQGGGAGEDRGLAAAAVAGDGSVLVTGFFSGSATFGADGPAPAPVTLVSQGAEDIFLARYDAAGNLVFAVSLGDSGSDEGMGVAALPGGGAVVAGFTTSAGIADALVAWYGPDGSLLQSKQANGTSDDRALGVAALPDASAFLTGSFAGTSVIFGFGETNETTLGPAAGASAIFTAKYFSYGP